MPGAFLVIKKRNGFLFFVPDCCLIPAITFSAGIIFDETKPFVGDVE